MESSTSKLEYCLKKIVTTDKNNDAEKTKKAMKNAINEAKIMKILKHPNLVRMHDYYRAKSDVLHIILEYADDGSIDTHIRDRQKSAQYYT